MKLTWPAEPTLSIPAVADGGSSGDAVVYAVKQGFFLMLSVMVFMSVLSIIVIKSHV